MNKTVRNLLIMSTFAVIAIGKTHAASNTTTTNTTTATSAAATKKLGLSVDVAYASNMYAQDDYNHSASTSLMLVTSYKTTNNLTTSLRGSVQKEHTHTQDVTTSNLTLRNSHKTAQLSENTTWRNRLDAILPMSRDAQLVDTLQFAIGGATSLAYDNKNTVLPYTVTATLALTRNVHEYETKTTGAKNNEYVLTEGLAVDLNITDALTISLAGNYRIAYAYDQTQKYLFDTSISTGYQINDNFSASIELANAASALKQNGVDSNINFLDEKTSELSIGLGYTY